jgi:hypothetical protein
MKQGLCVLAVFILLAPAVVAQDTVTEKVTNTAFDKTMGENPTLKLYGIAPRIKNILGVYDAKVYGVGMYADPQAIEAALGGSELTPIRLAAAMMASSGHRAIVLKFVRDLERQIMADAFEEGIELTIPIDDPRIADDAQTLLAAFTDIKNGDVATLYFAGSEVILRGSQNEVLAQVDNRLLGRALIAAYVGTEPVDKKVKASLLEGIK